MTEERPQLRLTGGAQNGRKCSIVRRPILDVGYNAEDVGDEGKEDGEAVG